MMLELDSVRCALDGLTPFEAPSALSAGSIASDYGSDARRTLGAPVIDLAIGLRRPIVVFLSSLGNSSHECCAEEPEKSEDRRHVQRMDAVVNRAVPLEAPMYGAVTTNREA